MFGAILELADDHLIIGHRLSEWCGHAPMLEEDLALPNMGLDMLGAARSLFTYAGQVEGKGRDEDDLAYLRLEREYCNCLLAARPNTDFAHTILKQLYFAAFMEPYWRAATGSNDETLRGIAGKSAKETAYHIRHCGEWVIRLGDGTEESARRMGDAVEILHPYAAELFFMSEVAQEAHGAGALPDRSELRAQWDETINMVFAQAGLRPPENHYAKSGGRAGVHEETMGHLLSDLQYMQRAYPDAVW